MTRAVWLMVPAIALVPMLGGCLGATGAMMNRDNKDQLRDRSKDERDTDISKQTPPSIQQNRQGAGADGDGLGDADGGHQIMAMGDDAIGKLTAMYRYLSATEAERATMLDLSSFKKLNLFGYAVAGVVIAVLVWVIWKKTRAQREALRQLAARAKAATAPLVERIKAVVAMKADETDPDRLARMNAEIARLNAEKADVEKHANGVAPA